MTVQVQNTTQYYAGPITKGTVLSIKDFTFADNSHVSVKIRNNPTPWRYGVDYTVSGANESDRTLTIQKDVAAEEVLVAYLDVPITQDVKPEEGGSFPADVQEYSLDKAIYICQMLQERISRSLQISVDTNFNGTLPELIPNRTFKINSSGTGIILSTYDPDQALVLTEDFKKVAEAAAAAAKTSEANAKISETNAKASETATEQLKNETAQIKQDTQAIANKAIQDINTEEASALAAVAASTQDAKDWAIKMDGKVNNEDYSSKHYANEAKLAASVSGRITGETIFSLDPLDEAGIHLFDGSLLNAGGIYDEFITKYIAKLYASHPERFTTEEDWQAKVAQYGVCGKYVYTEGVSVRLPKVTGIVEGTLVASELGDIVEAGLPNATGWVASIAMWDANFAGGMFTARNETGVYITNALNVTETRPVKTIDANLKLANPIYGNSTTVQPQTIKGYLYIVVATVTKTDIVVDIDNVVTDLNGKLDTDCTNATPVGTEFMAHQAMPSLKKLTLSLQASGATYTAPADGWFYLSFNTNNNTDSIVILTINGMGSSGNAVPFQGWKQASLPVSKGNVVAVSYQRNGTNYGTAFQFYYAQGAIND